MTLTLFPTEDELKALKAKVLLETGKPEEYFAIPNLENTSLIRRWVNSKITPDHPALPLYTTLRPALETLEIMADPVGLEIDKEHSNFSMGDNYFSYFHLLYSVY
jgi:hypothetical protein